MRLHFEIYSVNMSAVSNRLMHYFLFLFFFSCMFSYLYHENRRKRFVICTCICFWLFFFLDFVLFNIIQKKNDYYICCSKNFFVSIIHINLIHWCQFTASFRHKTLNRRRNKWDFQSSRKPTFDSNDDDRHIPKTGKFCSFSVVVSVLVQFRFVFFLHLIETKNYFFFLHMH